MNLSGKQHQKLLEAFIDAFPNKFSLEKMLLVELDKKLEVIVGGSNLEEIVFQLIQTAKSQGLLKDLVDAARRSNPGNPSLKAIAQELLTGQSTKTRPSFLFDHC